MSLNVLDRGKKCDFFTSCRSSGGLRELCLIQVLARCYILQRLAGMKMPKARLGIIQGLQAAV